MEAARLESAGDPLTVTRHVGDLYAMLHVELDRIAAVRIRAVRTLRAQGWSYDRIAHASGLSKARVAQLVRDTRPVVPDDPGSPERPG